MISHRSILASVITMYVGSCVVAQPRGDPYPLPPIGPTDARQCDAYQQEISEIKTNYDKQHEDCLSANSRSPAVQNSGGLVCSKSACQSLHDIVYGDFSNKADEAVKACRNQVQIYLHALETVRDTGAQQRQTMQIQGDAQIAVLDAGRNATDQQRDLIARQADSNRQRAADAQRLAEIYRQQADTALRERAEMTSNQLTSLDAAQRRIDGLRSSIVRFDDVGVAVDQSSSSYRTLVDSVRERMWDGVLAAFRASGERREQIADTVENAQSFARTISSFRTLAKNDSSIDQQMDAIKDLGDEANSRFNTNPVSRFLFPKLLSGGVVEPFRTAMHDIDNLIAASKGADVPMNELSDFASSDDPGRYFPFVAELRLWTQTSVVYRTVDKLREALGVGK